MKVLFPGSFDPIHEGHINIINRASQIFDEVVVLVANNPKKNQSNLIKRYDKVKTTIDNLFLDNVKVDFWSKKVVNYFEKYYFDVIIRSIRNSDDIIWESYIASQYRNDNIDCEVIYFLSDDGLKNVSSHYILNDIKKQKSIFIFDVDGTLLNDKKEILDSTIQSFNKLIINGHIPIIATGRTPFQVFEIAQKLNFDGYIIGASGASIYNIKNNEYEINKKSINIKDIEFLVKKAYELKRELLWSDGKKIYRVYFGKDIKSEIKDPLFFIGGTPFPKYDVWEECKYTLNDKIVQISIKAESWIIKSISEEMNKNISDESDYFVTSSVYYELVPKGINKYSAIKYIQNKYNIKNENTLAFGDSGNDIDMIKNCGYGIAMGNSTSELKSVADEIIGSNNEDSIQDFLIKNGYING
ncbi:MAG: Cof-type HAD-IIB family hydrolase [Mycoplasmoidaceae bacterium]